MGNLAGLLPIVAMFAVMWFFIIRPAQKRQKTTSQMQSNLKRGDDIITVGGLHAKVDAVDDQTIFVTVADGTRLQFERVAVGRVVSESKL
ncbi:preprotein translocase subunit YajC [Paenisporosarcina quisquiliarum]|jgi:preprotein translocase subunit YajC|uniref:Preprotein translocase subunit YajC n=1 Tax=Psychrobacillus psychrodurans TaxID=126157 RepID=A0A9X3LD08_9BACI|nr:preprotein translocase subunit YajC [Psychrobacillus psychrodurans]SEM50347.1 preprotein translocase subunit YajC [Paenisporosarcina quisquiliarum]MCK1996536.1 preprotein translocase subunit YajC [Psychrobacillus psychrodurans]MCZ8534979.1 preprotein translocase subunit YajC [Psychrobacillus psychrodurans]MCZ8542109.1 preprotein translocase subunit YajC [Psychrobacillus psychrodurans]SFN17943.1 preprotein translocase subunit YajC [Psychrobacillus psychrodurans]